ncbi:High mobility group HMG1/HMG2 [Macrophomina phaseolina MS6]|uniref:High mobility group HMG1/HMG2 n=1 Tax=Macrophomina phaseolina (strain MS6) TaxID=1126212 RepID=K2RUP0_MACPH|nr:High mobility group HMG1/HMG2 [Macrophomina phaseolina MS6]
MGCLLGPASPPGKPKIPPGRPSLALSPSHLFHPLCRRCPPINFHHQPACIAMGRPRKDDKQKETAELMISVEDFARTRDSVVTGLTTLQTAVTDLLRSYLKHTNSVLGQTPYRLDTFGISNPLNNNEILAGALRDSPPAAAGPIPSAAPQAVAAATSAPAAAPAPVEEEPVKKGRKPKKEKKEKDPNEPKRPLTMYFLFSAQARPIVKQDLGPDVTPGQVEEEIKKRWRELTEEEKAGWKEVYEQNRVEYIKRMDEYKSSLAGAAKSPADADGDVDMAEGTAAAAGVGAEESADVSEEAESDETSPPPKAPSPPAESKTPKNKRRKTGKENGVVAASSAAAPAHAASPIPLPSHPKNSAVEGTPVAKSKTEKKGKKEEAPKEPAADEPPKKKRGRKSKGAEEAAAAPEPAAAEPEKKNKRKRKSEVAAA